MSPALSLSLSLSFSFSLFFWTRNGRAPSGVTSEATQHCCENNCHNIHYHDQAAQTVKERHLGSKQTVPSKRNKFRQVERTAQFSCKLFRLKATPVHAKLTHWGHRGTSTSVPSPLPLQRPTECSGGDLPVSRQSPSGMSKAAVLTGFLGSGVVARVAAATISQPTDGHLSKVNKTGAGGDGPVIGRLSRLADGSGMAKLCTQGLFAFLRVHVVDWRVAFSLRRPWPSPGRLRFWVLAHQLIAGYILLCAVRDVQGVSPPGSNH